MSTPTTQLPANTAASPRVAPAATVRFSAELREMIGRCNDRPLRVGALLEGLHDRGRHLLLVLIALPFVTPVPLPGVSMPFGILVALVGVGFVFNQRPWLPQIILRRELSPDALAKVLGAATWTLKILETFTRPRLHYLQSHRAIHRSTGLLITMCGLFMALPIPLPLSNSLPAWTVLLLAVGTICHDGLFFIAGSVMFVITVAFFWLITVGGAAAFDVVRRFIAWV